MESITLSESKRLNELELIIEEGQEAWLSVGIALTEIRDKKLYRAEFATFKEYCQSTWHWTDKRAYQLIDAAEESSTSGRTFGSEREARKAKQMRIAANRPKLSSPSEAESASKPSEDSLSVVSNKADSSSLKPSSPASGGLFSDSEPPHIRTADEIYESEDYTSDAFISDLEYLVSKVLDKIQGKQARMECVMSLRGQANRIEMDSK